MIAGAGWPPFHYYDGMNSVVGILDEPEIRKAALPLTVEQYHRLSAKGIVPERTDLFSIE